MKSEADITKETDGLYQQAIITVRTREQVSISHLQRCLRIGYNRAARLLEAMESDGIIGHMKTDGTRDVLKTPKEAQQCG